MSKISILAIDDDPLVQCSYKLMFEPYNIEVQTCANGFAGLHLFREDPNKFPIVLLDYDMTDKVSGAGINGDIVAAAIKKTNKNTRILVISGNTCEEVAANCLKAGAEQFVVKSTNTQRLVDTVRIMVSSLEEPIDGEDNIEERQTMIKKVLKMVGKSRELAKVADLIARFSAFDEPVLILGESGVGKEGIARAVHENSPRKNKKFVAVNCTAIGKDLLESELFGHEKGSFTGAYNKKIGLFEQAEGGTIFLDEIGDMAIELQAKLLRTLQEKIVHPVGGMPRAIDFRVVCATHQNLKAAVEDGRFRQDLYYRIKYMTIDVPPLRERPEDIEPLILHFINQMNEKTNGQKRISEKAIRTLKSHSWVGNVRDLEAAVKKAYVISNSIIRAEDFEEEFSKNAVEHFSSLKNESSLLTYNEFEQHVKEFERWVLTRALQLSGNNQREAARLLGMNKSTFQFRYANLKTAVQNFNRVTSLKGGK